MARAIDGAYVRQCAAAVLAGSLLGGLLGLASAQVADTGHLDNECVARCAGHGYDAEFCGNVCWVPDLAKSAEADNLDWKCMTTCRERGGHTRSCMANCRTK